MAATKLRVSFDLDCADALRVLTEAGVPDPAALIADGIARQVGEALAGHPCPKGLKLPGLLHGDPTTGLPEVTVAPVED